MDIYNALEKDHRKIEQLFTELISLTDNAKMERSHVLASIQHELIPHARAEEAVFYNSLRTLDHTKDLALHGYKDHIQAESLLRLLQVEDLTGMEWMNTAIKLREAIFNHIAEEETILFDAAKDNFTSEEAEMFGKAFEQLKPKIRHENIVETTIDMVSNLMPPRFMR